jgi:uncharacterized membrane protein
MLLLLAGNRLTNNQKIILTVAGLASLLPIWRSGLREHMNFWEWIINHTIWGPPSEYIPEEYYLPTTPTPIALTRRIEK